LGGFSSVPRQSLSVWQNFFMTHLIQVTVKLFAAYQEAYGKSELVLDLPPETTVADVRDRLLQEHPSLEQWRNLTRFGVNFQFVEPDACLQNGDELVLIPPVSGG
jgi:sulfur-carrier protein